MQKGAWLVAAFYKMASPSVNVVEKNKEEIGEESIQFEVLEEDAFQLVCHVTDLATLESGEKLLSCKKYLILNTKINNTKCYK